MIGWHILLPAFTVGLASYIALMEGLSLFTGREVYGRISVFWTRIFSVSFGMGVVSGVIMPFQFGTNWSRFSDATANIIAPLLAYEGLMAFFLEAAFLGVLLFGRSLVPRAGPTTLSPDGRSRPPHMRSWRDGWRNLRFLLLFCPAWLFFYPGIVLLLLGVAGMAWLLPATRYAFGLGFDVNTLVFTAGAIVCGFQAIVFYLFAKTYAIRQNLLPVDSLVTRLRQVLRLEVALLVGAAAVLVGIALAVLAVGSWGARAFGHLDPQQSLRIVVPSVTLMILGLQIMFSSFLLSLLQIETNRAAATPRIAAANLAPTAETGVR